MTQAIACFTPNAIKTAVAQSAAVIGLSSKQIAILFDGIDAAAASYMMMGCDESKDKQPEGRRLIRTPPEFAGGFAATVIVNAARTVTMHTPTALDMT